MEQIYENFDALFRKLYAQAQRVEALESRVTELERRLREREAEEYPVLHLVGTVKKSEQASPNQN